MSRLKKFLLSTLLILLSAIAIITVSDGINILRGISAQPTSITVGDIIVASPWVDIRYYGAKVDGITDDTTKAQLAINSLQPGQILLVPGNCKITSGLTINGKTRITIKGNGLSGFTASTPTFHIFTVSGSSSDVKFDSLLLTGASIADEGRAGIYISDGLRTKVRFCKFTTLNLGVWIDNPDSNECEISQNDFISLVGATTGDAILLISQRNKIIANTFNGVARHDIYLSGYSALKSAINNVVAGNISINSGVEAVVMYALDTQLSVSGNIVKGNVIINPVIGIGCDANATLNIIDGNTIRGATGKSIFMNGGVINNSYPNGNIINGNIVSDTAVVGGGIVSVNASNIILTNNRVQTTGDSGINCYKNGVPTVVPNNYVVIGNNGSGASSWDILVSADIITKQVANNIGTVSSP